MSQLSFVKMSLEKPLNIAPDLLTQLKIGGYSPEFVGIDDSAVFEDTVTLQRVSKIGAQTVLHGGVTVEKDVYIGDNVEVYESTYLSRKVMVGSTATLGVGNFFAEGAIIPFDYKSRAHEYLRKTREDVTIGPNVVLPAEFQIGNGAIIPTSESVSQIGRFGESKRMVTAYGSEDGPKYSVGCQYGIDMVRFRERINLNEGTTPKSAADYKRNLPEIEALGMKVQEAYDRETNLVVELLDLRNHIMQVN